MGLIRKTMSISTLGLIDYRSDKERIANIPGKRAIPLASPPPRYRQPA